MYKLLKDNLGHQGSWEKLMYSEREVLKWPGCCPGLSRGGTDVSRAERCCAGEVEPEGMGTRAKGLVDLDSFF